MRLATTALLYGTAILLLAGCALSEPTNDDQVKTSTIFSFTEAQNGEVGGKPSLRTLKETSNTEDEEFGEEERVLTLSGLKQWIPGARKSVTEDKIYKKLEAEQLNRFQKIAKAKARAATKKAAEKTALAKVFDGIVRNGDKRFKQFVQWHARGKKSKTWTKLAERLRGTKILRVNTDTIAKPWVRNRHKISFEHLKDSCR